MSPCSDVRALARALGEGGDYVTFIDVLPLQRLAQALVHMPRSTLEAVVQLHDAPHVTLGAKDVLMDVLRSYQHRAQSERRLAQRLLGQSHAHKTIRLQVGQQATIALSCSREESWQVTCCAVGDASGQATVTSERHPRRREQQLLVTATAPGHLQLEALKTTAAPARPAPWHSTAPKAAPTQSSPTSFRMGIVIEDDGQMLEHETPDIHLP